MINYILIKENGVSVGSIQCIGKRSELSKVCKENCINIPYDYESAKDMLELFLVSRKMNFTFDEEYHRALIVDAYEYIMKDWLNAKALKADIYFKFKNREPKELINKCEWLKNIKYINEEKFDFNSSYPKTLLQTVRGE